MNRTDKLRQALSFDKKGLVCLVPNKDSINENSMLLSSHEKTLCDCQVLETMAKAEKLHKVLCDAVATIEHHIDCRDNYKATDLRSLDKALTAIDAVLEGEHD